MRVAHEAHECGKRDAGPGHVGSKSMAETMGICIGDRAHTAVMTKYGSQTSGCEGFAPVWPLEDEEDEGGVRVWSFQTQVAINYPEGLGIEGEESLAVSLSPNEHFVLSWTKIVEFEAESLAGAQSVEKHQGNKAQIAKGAKSVPESRDLGCRKRNDNTVGCFESEFLDDSPGPQATKGRWSGVSRLLVRDFRGDLTPVVETVQTLSRGNAMIDGLWGGLGLLVQLEADVVEQLRVIEFG
jgi:hypothetical protein